MRRLLPLGSVQVEAAEPGVRVLQEGLAGATNTPRRSVSEDSVRRPYAREPTTTDSTVCSVTRRSASSTAQADARPAVSLVLPGVRLTPLVSLPLSVIRTMSVNCGGGEASVRPLFRCG